MMIKRKKNKHAAANLEWFNSLGLDQKARFAALVEGINVIADMADEKHIKFESVPVKIPELQKYVDSTSKQISRAWSIV